MPPPGVPVNYKTVPCKFFPLGQCTRGEACTFLHEGAEPALYQRPQQPAVYQQPAAFQQPAWQPQQAAGTKGIPCKFFAQGACAKGDACQFQHYAESPPSLGKGYDKGYGKACGKGFDKGFGKPNPIGFGSKNGKGFEKGFEKGFGKDFGKDFGKFGKDKGKGKKGKSKFGGKGHLLPRETISEAPITGTVLEWKGKFGWIEPLEALDHPKAQKHGGKIFVSVDDIGDLEELAPGATVEFQVWEDDSGLGAEQVIQY